MLVWIFHVFENINNRVVDIHRTIINCVVMFYNTYTQNYAKVTSNNNLLIADSQIVQILGRWRRWSFLNNVVVASL